MNNVDKTSYWSDILIQDLSLAMVANKSVIKYLNNTDSASVINVVRIKNTAGFPQDFGYINTKNALLLLTKNSAAIPIENDIRINNIVIGHTPSMSNYDNSSKYQQLQELSEAILFFASTGSNHMTGEDIFVIDEQVVTTIAT